MLCTMRLALPFALVLALQTVVASAQPVPHTALRAVDEDPLLLLAETGHVRSISERIQAGADVNVRDVSGMTPLMRAATQQRAEVIRLLLLKGANVNLTDQAGHTAYWHAMHVVWVGRVPFTYYGYELHLPRLMRTPAAQALAAVAEHH